MEELLKKLEVDYACYKAYPNKNVVIKIETLFALVDEVKRLTSEIEKVPEESK